MAKYELDDKEVSNGMVSEAAVAYDTNIRRSSMNVVEVKAKYGDLKFTDQQLHTIIKESESSVVPHWTADEACSHFRSKIYEC